MQLWEQEAKLEAKRREEGQRKIEESEKRHRDERERRLEWARKQPEIQIRRFVSGERFKCSLCHFKLYYEAFCHNSSCQSDRARDTEPLMNELSRLVNIIGMDEVLRLLGIQLQLRW
jgi:hypothetical protein